MTIIGLLAQKGGVGKTTLALHWAVEAARRHYGRVAVIDMDPQASAIGWYQRRQRETPVLLQANAHNISQALAACKAEGFDLVLVDTKPYADHSSERVAREADLAVIPCGPSTLEIEAISHTVAIGERAAVPAVIVINQGRHSSSINTKVAGVLAQYEAPVCPVVIMRRALLEDALINGQTAAEIDPRSKAAHEITESWQWIVNQHRHTNG